MPKARASEIPALRQVTHLDGFFGALREQVPAVFEDFRENVLPLFQAFSPRGELPIHNEMSADPTLQRALEEWLARSHLTLRASSRLEGLTYWGTWIGFNWANTSAAADAMDISNTPIHPEIGIAPKKKRLFRDHKEIDPPRYRCDEVLDDYLKRATDYWFAALASRHLPQTVAPFDPKVNSEHYAWAAVYQCEPGMTKGSAAERFKHPEPDDFLKAVKRTLAACGLRVRPGRRGPKRKGDAS